MKLALATKEDFRLFWRLKLAYQLYREAYECDDMRLREKRALRVILGRLDQMGGAFIRVVHGCEILIDKVQEPTEDTYCLKPIYGAAPELLEAAKRLEARSFFNPVSCADDATLEDMRRMRQALLDAAKGGAQ